VLTRLPPPHRLSPADSGTLLETNFMNQGVEMIALEADTYRRLLQAAPERGVAGGSIYDAVIVACGLAASVDVVLTFNERQFRPLAFQRIEIVVPP
jgi:predicted nucleic acid-binding protein